VAGRSPKLVWIAALLIYLGAVVEVSLLLPEEDRIQVVAMAGLSVAFGMVGAPRGVRLLTTLVAALLYVSLDPGAEGLIPGGNVGRGLTWAAYFLLPMLIGASLARAVTLLRASHGEQ
jgi:hypothetical protein